MTQWTMNRISCLNSYRVLMIVLILVFFLFKIPVLGIPYFWDEAWSYMPAISRFAKLGPSLFPGALPVELYRGHPLFYYFLAASWMQLSGGSFFAMHSFALIITCFLFITLFVIASNLFDRRTAFLASLLFSIQPIVLGQATFVLPEMLMALLSLASVFAIVKKKYIAYLFLCSALLYTKESGIVAVIAILASQITRIYFKTENGSLWNHLKQTGIILLPVCFVMFFFIIQKQIQGWFFFPEHISFLNFNVHSIVAKLALCLKLLFVDQKRGWIGLFCLILIITSNRKSSFIKEIKLTPPAFHFYIIAAYFLVFYIFFSSINFFTYRYLLSLIPFWCILMSTIIDRTYAHSRILYVTVVVVLMICYYLENTNVISIERNRVANEYNLGFSDAVLVQRDMCDYLQARGFNDKVIYTSYVYNSYLSKPEAGYIKNASFDKVTSFYPCKAEYLIYSSIEQDPDFKNYSEECKLSLIKRFSRGYAWAELYKIN